MELLTSAYLGTAPTESPTSPSDPRPSTGAPNASICQSDADSASTDGCSGCDMPGELERRTDGFDDLRVDSTTR